MSKDDNPICDKNEVILKWKQYSEKYSDFKGNHKISIYGISVIP